MYKLTNHSKKGIIILILVMMVVIPNMDVYSILGNYQISSPAIKANNLYYPTKYSSSQDNPIPIGLFSLGEIALVSIAIGGLVLLALGVSGGVLGVAFSSQDGKTFLSPLNSIGESYMKYDFSQFDNYTPSSMKPEF